MLSEFASAAGFAARMTVILPPVSPIKSVIPLREAIAYFGSIENIGFRPPLAWEAALRPLSHIGPNEFHKLVVDSEDLNLFGVQ